MQAEKESLKTAKIDTMELAKMAFIFETHFKDADLLTLNVDKTQEFVEELTRKFKDYSKLQLSSVKKIFSEIENPYGIVSRTFSVVTKIKTSWNISIRKHIAIMEDSGDDLKLLHGLCIEKLHTDKINKEKFSKMEVFFYLMMNQEGEILEKSNLLTIFEELIANVVVYCYNHLKKGLFEHNKTFQELKDEDVIESLILTTHEIVRCVRSQRVCHVAEVILCVIDGTHEYMQMENG